MSARAVASSITSAPVALIPRIPCASTSITSKCRDLTLSFCTWSRRIARLSATKTPSYPGSLSVRYQAGGNAYEMSYSLLGLSPSPSQFPVKLRIFTLSYHTVRKNVPHCDYRCHKLIPKVRKSKMIFKRVGQSSPISALNRNLSRFAILSVYTR